MNPLTLGLTGLAVYFSYHFLKGYYKKESHEKRVKGKQRSKPLDLKNMEVEDAHYEDINDGEQ